MPEGHAAVPVRGKPFDHVQRDAGIERGARE